MEIAQSYQQNWQIWFKHNEGQEKKQIRFNRKNETMRLNFSQGDPIAPVKDCTVLIVNAFLLWQAFIGNRFFVILKVLWGYRGGDCQKLRKHLYSVHLTMLYCPWWSGERKQFSPFQTLDLSLCNPLPFPKPDFLVRIAAPKCGAEKKKKTIGPVLI